MAVTFIWRTAVSVYAGLLADRYTGRFIGEEFRILNIEALLLSYFFIL